MSKAGEPLILKVETAQVTAVQEMTLDASLHLGIVRAQKSKKLRHFRLVRSLTAAWRPQVDPSLTVAV